MKKNTEYQSQTKNLALEICLDEIYVTVCLPRGIDLSQFLKQFQNARLAKTHKNNGKDNI